LGMKEECWTIPEAQIAARLSFTPNIIKLGFEKTGIWPWKPEILMKNFKYHMANQDMDEVKKHCIDLIGSVIDSAKKRVNKRNNGLIKEKIVVKKNYAMDLSDHLEKAEERRNELQLKEEVKVNRKRQREQKKRETMRMKIQKNEEAEKWKCQG